MNRYTLFLRVSRNRFRWTLTALSMNLSSACTNGTNLMSQLEAFPQFVQLSRHTQKKCDNKDPRRHSPNPYDKKARPLRKRGQMIPFVCDHVRSPNISPHPFLSHSGNCHFHRVTQINKEENTIWDQRVYGRRGVDVRDKEFKPYFDCMVPKEL